MYARVLIFRKLRNDRTSKRELGPPTENLDGTVAVLQISLSVMYLEGSAAQRED